MFGEIFNPVYRYVHMSSQFTAWRRGKRLAIFDGGCLMARKEIRMISVFTMLQDLVTRAIVSILCHIHRPTALRAIHCGILN
jgi:hypothetical protein